MDEEDGEPDAAANGADVESPAPETQRPRPERVRRSERIWDSPPVVANSDAVQRETRVSEPPPPPAPTRRHEIGSSEPRIERVVVAPDQAGEGAGDASAAPQRKGWWQRRFGSD